MRGRFGTLLLALALVAAGVAAQAWGGAGGATLSAPSGGEDAGAVACARGKVATAGGFRSAGQGWRTRGTRPRGRRWALRLQNLDPAPSTARLRKRCLPRQPIDRVRAADTVTLEPFDGEYVEVTARCPAGTSMAGGGFSAAASPHPTLLTSAPAGERGWRTRAYVNEEGTHTLRAFVLCDRSDARYVTRTDATVVSPPRRRGTLVPWAATAECPEGWRVTGAGFDVNDLNERFRRLVPARSRVALSGNTHSNQPKTAFARCRQL